MNLLVFLRKKLINLSLNPIENKSNLVYILFTFSDIPRSRVIELPLPRYPCIIDSHV